MLEYDAGIDWKTPEYVYSDILIRKCIFWGLNQLYDW